VIFFRDYSSWVIDRWNLPQSHGWSRSRGSAFSQEKKPGKQSWSKWCTSSFAKWKKSLWASGYSQRVDTSGHQEKVQENGLKISSRQKSQQCRSWRNVQKDQSCTQHIIRWEKARDLRQIWLLWPLHGWSVRRWVCWHYHDLLLKVVPMFLLVNLHLDGMLFWLLLLLLLFRILLR